MCAVLWNYLSVCVCVCVCEREREREREGERERYEVAMRWWVSKLIFLVLLQLMNCPDILNGHKYRILSNYVFR